MLGKLPDASWIAAGNMSMQLRKASKMGLLARCTTILCPMSNGHSSRDMLIYAIEIVHGDVVTTGVRERYWINKLDTIRNGLNTYKT